MLNVQKLLFFIQTVYNLSLVSLQFYTMPPSKEATDNSGEQKKVNKYSKMFSLKNCDSVPQFITKACLLGPRVYYTF